jgi:hypothetical protein
MGFWHSEHNLPRGKLQRQVRDENLRRLRSSLTEAFPSSLFSNRLKFPHTVDRPWRRRVPHQSEGRQFAHYRRVFQRRARVTIIVIIVSERTRLRRTASIQSRSMLQLEPHKPRLTRASLSFYSSIVEELISALCVVSRRLACMNFRFLSFPLKRISKHRNKKVNKETSHVLQHIDFADP